MDAKLPRFNQLLTVTVYKRHPRGCFLSHWSQICTNYVVCNSYNTVMLNCVIFIWTEKNIECRCLWIFGCGAVGTKKKEQTRNLLHFYKFISFFIYKWPEIKKIINYDMNNLLIFKNLHSLNIQTADIMAVSSSE